MGNDNDCTCVEGLCERCQIATLRAQLAERDAEIAEYCHRIKLADRQHEELNEVTDRLMDAHAEIERLKDEARLYLAGEIELETPGKGGGDDTDVA